MQKFIIMLLFCTSSLVFSQGRSPYYNEYIERMNNKLNMKFEFDNDVESYEYGDKLSGYSIKPNINYRNILSANYRFITFKIGYTPRYLANKSIDTKGKTKTFKLQSDIYIRNWMQTFEYSKVSGYYVTDIVSTSNLDPFSEDDIIILPHLKTRTFTGITRFKFNPDFSLKALLNQQEIQRKSAGSFVPSLTWNSFKIYDKSSIQDLKSFSLVFNAAYYYTYVLNEKWYSTLGAGPGIGFGFNELTTKSENGNSTTKNNDLVFNVNAHLGIGYNSKSFFGGLALRGIGTARDDNSVIEFNTLRGIFQIFVGYRFKSPKFVEEGMDWLEDQNPLF
jgi:hypothetical protein